MIVMMLQRNSILTYFLEEDLRFHLAKWQFVCACFAILDYADKFIAKHNESTIRESAERILETYSPKYIFTCEQHTEKGLKFAAKIVVNIFYNNKQKLASDEVRKHTVKCFKKRPKSKEN